LLATHALRRTFLSVIDVAELARMMMHGIVELWMATKNESYGNFLLESLVIYQKDSTSTHTETIAVGSLETIYAAERK